MENASYARVRLESPPYSTKRGVGVLSLIYILGLALCLGVGIKRGPSVFERFPEEEPEYINTPSLNITWYGQVDGMERWHQVLFLHMQLRKPTTVTGAVSYEQRYTVSSWASEAPLGPPPSGDTSPCYDDQQCTADCDGYGQCVKLAERSLTDRVINCGSTDEWCGWTTLLTEDFVKYGVYYMEVVMQEPALFEETPMFTLSFEMVYIHKEFTKFQMKSHYFWVLIALVFMFVPKIGFFYEMFHLHHSFWSRQQARVGILLASLLFFNNVFFAAQIFSPFPQAFFSIYMVLLATFLALMLFYWLELFSDLAAGNMQGTDTAQEWERNRGKTLREYLPKLFLVGLIWVTTIMVYIYVRVRQTGDPSYSTVDDLSSYTGAKVSGLLLYLAYFVWLGILIEKTVRHVQQMNIEYIFVTVITLVTIFGAMSAIFTGAFAPDQHGSKVFTFFYGMFNIYVLFLAFLYTPIGSAYGDLNAGDNVQMVETAETAADDTSFTVVESSRQHTIL